MSTFTPDEKSNLLFKKLMGKPSTLNEKDFFQEPRKDARPAIFQHQIYTTAIPNTASSTLLALTENSNDTNGNHMEGSYIGFTDNVVTRYIKIQLSMIPGTNGASWEAKKIINSGSHPNGYADGIDVNNTGTVGTYENVLSDAIPFNYDTISDTYNVHIYRDNGGKAGVEIPFGDSGGHWILDNEAGIVTFYQYSNISSIVDVNKPIYISFYRYTGVKGNFYSSGGMELTEDGIPKFVKGDNTKINDRLTTLIIDSETSLSTLQKSNFSQALQFGGSSIGAWRICVQGGNGSETATSLVFQYRVGDGTTSNPGIWKTITSWSI